MIFLALSILCVISAVDLVQAQLGNNIPTSDLDGMQIGVKSGDRIKYKISSNIYDIDQEIARKIQIELTGIHTLPDWWYIRYFDEMEIIVDDVDYDPGEIVYTMSLFHGGAVQSSDQNSIIQLYSHTIPIFGFPINGKIGDLFPSDGTRFTVENSDRKLVDGILIDVFKATSDSIKLSIDGVTASYSETAYFEKTSGLMIEYNSILSWNILGVKPDTLEVNITALEIYIPGRSVAGGGCLIATATYGTELASQVQFLREIRDNTLMSTKSGALFITGFNGIYYSFSPAIADLERKSPVVREMIRLLITPMLATMPIMSLAEEGSESHIISLGVSVIALNIMMYVGIPVTFTHVLKKQIRS